MTTPTTTKGTNRLGLVITVVVGFVLLIAVPFIFQPRTYSDTPGAPDNPSSNGAMAVAEVLGSEGVTVDITRSFTEAVNTDAQAFVITSLYQLHEEEAEALIEEGKDLIFIGTAPELSDIFEDVDVETIEGSDTVQPGCDDPRAQGGAITLPSSQVPKLSGAQGCFPGTDKGHLLTWELPSGIDATFISSHTITNSSITKDANAALAFRVLGAYDHIMWYVATPPSPTEGDQPGLSFNWVWSALVVLFIGVVWWKGPRFGRLVSEPLPVIVEASETTIGRGKLYQQVKDPAHAARALRIGTLNAIGPRLGFGPNSSPQEIIIRIAQATSRDPAAVDHLFYGPPPTTNQSLHALALSLEAVEKEVEHV